MFLRYTNVLLTGVSVARAVPVQHAKGSVGFQHILYEDIMVQVYLQRKSGYVEPPHCLIILDACICFSAVILSRQNPTPAPRLDLIRTSILAGVATTVVRLHHAAGHVSAHQ